MHASLKIKEASKFARRIMHIERILSTEVLAKRLAISPSTIRLWFDDYEMRKSSLDYKG